MHKEIEGRDDPERCHGGLLPPRSGGSFFLSSLLQSKGAVQVSLGG
jgi:hypothetical protein